MSIIKKEPNNSVSWLFYSCMYLAKVRQTYDQQHSIICLLPLLQLSIEVCLVQYRFMKNYAYIFITIIFLGLICCWLVGAVEFKALGQAGWLVGKSQQWGADAVILREISASSV